MGNEELEDKQYIKASSRWLFEMNFLNNDYIKSALIANIYVQSRFIKNTEILVDQHNKRMLILIELSYIGNLFKNKKKLGRDVEEIIKDALPSYNLRVVYDRPLFEKATEMLNPILKVSDASSKESFKETPQKTVQEGAEDSEEV